MEITRTQELRRIIEAGAASAMSLPEIIQEEIRGFFLSPQYGMMEEAERYYRNRSAVQGKTTRFQNRSNTKIEHPILKKLIDQKVNYLLSRPFSVEGSSPEYTKALEELFDRPFRQKVQSLGKGAVKSGIAWLAPYFENNRLQWMRLPSTEVIPLWQDAEHTRLDGYIRVYSQIVYSGREKKTVARVEFWDKTGVTKYKTQWPVTTSQGLQPDYDGSPAANQFPHFTINGKPYSWGTAPLVWAKYNEEELPLQYFLKELIDDMNWQTSLTADALRDVAKFIFVLKNYGGQGVDQFVRELQEALAIQVEADGGVEKLEPTIHIEAVTALLEKTRRDIFDFGSGVDTKDPELGNASGTAIHFRYMDLDADCASLGAQLQDTFQQMKPFLDQQLLLAGKGDFSHEGFTVTFNADLPVNETDIIQNIQASQGIVSRRTLLANHPWVTNVEAEEKALAQEKQAAMAEFGGNLFPGPTELEAGGQNGRQ